MFGQLKNQVLVNSKIFLTPHYKGLELFKIIKEYGPKDLPPSNPGVELEPPYFVISKNEILEVFHPFIQRSLTNTRTTRFRWT